MHAVGIDSVEIERFAHWHRYPIKILLKIFTPAEIEYCLAERELSAQRFAARFAVKEAAFKAATQTTGLLPKAFLAWCRTVEITLAPSPTIVLHDAHYAELKLVCSITHTKITATAVVLVTSCCSFPLQR